MFSWLYRNLRSSTSLLDRRLRMRSWRSCQSRSRLVLDRGQGSRHLWVRFTPVCEITIYTLCLSKSLLQYYHTLGIKTIFSLQLFHLTICVYIISCNQCSIVATNVCILVLMTLPQSADDHEHVSTDKLCKWHDSAVMILQYKMLWSSGLYYCFLYVRSWFEICLFWPVFHGFPQSSANAEMTCQLGYHHGLQYHR
jgi:hypothetical protein